ASGNSDASSLRPPSERPPGPTPSGQHRGLYHRAMGEVTTVRALRAALSDETADLTGRAARAATALDERCTGPRREWGRLLVHVEGTASAAIHGSAAPLVDVLLAMFGGRHDTAAMEVADAIAVTAAAVSAPSPLTAKAIQTWHRTLMRRVPTLERRQIRRWRDTETPGGPAPDAIAKAGDEPVAFRRPRNPE